MRTTRYLIGAFATFFLIPFGISHGGIGTATFPAGPAVPSPQTQNGEGEKAIVNYYGDLMAKRGANDSILYLNDHVAFHHNGAFIQCDSARRYDEYRMECFGNVIINKDSTFIYGDRATYDGHTNLAKVYSPLLKLVNGEATMWVYDEMEFDTRTNVGKYDRGGVIFLRDNLMESDRGIYNGDSATITFVGHVAMRNTDYRMRTDSIGYDLNNEVVTFLSKTYIWDQERDFLTADRGQYVRATQTYHFTRNAYAMTADQEFWADTMDYESVGRRVTMRHNIQMLDTAQRAIGLGDFGFYDDSLGNGMLTARPAVILYDSVAEPDRPAADSSMLWMTDSLSRAERPAADSTFARADTLFFHTYGPGQSKPGLKRQAQGDSTTRTVQTDSLAIATVAAADSTAGAVADSTVVTTDSLAIAAVAATDSTAGTVADSTAADRIRRAAAIGAEEPPLPEAPDSTVGLGVDPASLLPDSSGMAPRKDSLERVVRGRHHVKLWRTDVQGVCDSLTAYSVDSMAILYGRPIIWNGDNQLTADRIELFSRDGEIDYAEFIGSPFITQKAEHSDTLFNQAEGRFLQAWFRENEIHRAIMTGNVINYYFVGQDSLPPDEMYVVSCASLTIDFEDQEPVRFNWGGAGDGYIDPLDKVPAGQSLQLKGFSWEPERKPTGRYDITDRSVRPSQRREAEGYALPVFSIEERFRQTRQRLLDSGTWRDRSEPLWVTLDIFNTSTLLY